VATKENPKANRSAFIGITTGIDISNFTDFATSPLRYNGVTSYFGASFSVISLFNIGLAIEKTGLIDLHQVDIII